MDINTIRVFAVSKLDWIKKHQQKLQNRVREVPLNYLTGENHYYLGETYSLQVHQVNTPAKIELNYNSIDLYVRPSSTKAQKAALLDKWYRERLKLLIPVLISKWEKELGVTVHEFGIKKMKTKWGTCNINKGRIWLNLELAKRSSSCLEYVVVHEMVHLLEKNHNYNFKQYMTRFIPQWKAIRQELRSISLQ